MAEQTKQAGSGPDPRRQRANILWSAFIAFFACNLALTVLPTVIGGVAP